MSTSADASQGLSPAVLAFHKLLEGVSSTEELLAKLCSDAQRLLLERASVPRSFDRTLVDTVFRRDIERSDATWEWLIAQLDVESIDGLPGEHRVRDAVRKQHRDQLLATLQTEPERWERHVEESRRIAEVLDEKDPRQASERLYHLAIANPPDAERLFVQAYDEADARFDFARCEHLLATVDTQLGLIEEMRTDAKASIAMRENALSLQRTLDDRERLFSARRRFADELRKSVHILERQFMRDEVTALATTDDQWIVNLESEGGRGKTAFLNWLIARHLVPSRIPVAKVDFDTPRWSQGHHQPWEFLLHIAQELDVQLRGAPLRTLIGEIESGMETSGQRAAAAVQRRRHRDESRNIRLEEDLAEDVPERLGRALAEATSGPVVIALDTLEELSLRGLASLVDVISVIDQVRTRCPKLKLYLAGRFNLERRHVDVWGAFGVCVRRVRILNFDTEEAREFLMRVRGIGPLELALELAEKTRRLPFQLALAADLVQSNGLTLAEVRKMEHLDLYYLVRKILKRIESADVRWFLRYGVVPKALTREFVEEVMLPELRLAMAGSKVHDDPDTDPEELLADGQQFPTSLASPDAPLDVDAIWAALQSYASECSFVAADGGPRDALVFHADVRLPMRRVLQQRAAQHRDSVFVRLHERAWTQAMDDATRSRTTDAAAWAEAMTRALYHGYQLSTARGEKSWRQVVRALDTTMDDMAAERVASELSLPEYVDDDGRPLLRGDGTPMVPGETLVRARFECARRRCRIAQSAEGQQSGSDEWWDRTREALDSLDRLIQAYGMEGVPRVELTLLRADVHESWPSRRSGVELRDAGQTIHRQLRAELRRAKTARDRFRLEVAIARLGARTKPVLAIDALRATLRRHAGNRSVKRHERVPVLHELASLSQQWMRLEEGLEAATEAYDLMKADASAFSRGNALRWRAALKWTARDAAGAVEDCRRAAALLRQGKREPGYATAHAVLLQMEGEIHLYLRDYSALRRVQADIEKLIPFIRSSDASDAGEANAASLSAYLGLLKFLRDVSQLQFASINQSLDAARVGYETLGDSERLMFILYTELRFRFQDEGDGKSAEALALRVGRTRADDIDVSTVRARVLAAEVLAAGDRVDESEEHLRELVARATEMDPRMRVHLYVRALALQSPARVPINASNQSPARPPTFKRKQLVSGLCDALREISPEGLRLRILADQLQWGEELALTPAECTQVTLSLARANAFERRTITSASPSSLRALNDVARVALTLGRFEVCTEILARIGPIARTRAFLPLLPMVQALELDASRQGYLPATLASAEQATKWSVGIGSEPATGVAWVQEAALHQLRGDDATAAELARLAEKLLGRPDTPPTIWKAQAQELLALCSPREAERERARRAAIEYHALRGDQAEVARLDAWGGANAATVEDEDVEAPVTVLVTRALLMKGAASLKIVSNRPHGPSVQAPPGKDELWLGMARDVSQRSTLGYPRESLQGFSTSWPKSCAALGHELDAALRRAYDGAAEREATDLELQFGESVSLLAALPWEMALHPDSPSAPRFIASSGTVRLVSRCPTLRTIERKVAHIRWVQRLLSVLGKKVQQDGLDGPVTRRALHEITAVDRLFDPEASRNLIASVGRHRGITNPRLFTVKGDSSLTLRRGIRSRAAIDPSHSHTASDLAGFDVTTADPFGGTDVTEVLRRGDYEVVLLTGSVRTDTRRGGVVFDFVQLDDSTGNKVTSLDASYLSKLIWNSSRPLRPTVVIEAQIGGGESERMRALFLRNLFCAELASHESAAAVVGMGLESEYSSARTSAQLLQALRRGESIGDAVSGVQSSEPDALPTDLASWDEKTLQLSIPTHGIAMWANMPRHVFIPTP
ncbi:MAG: hypothetical protein ABI601_12435 [bacterium]